MKPKERVPQPSVRGHAPRREDVVRASSLLDLSAEAEALAHDASERRHARQRTKHQPNSPYTTEVMRDFELPPRPPAHSSAASSSLAQPDELTLSVLRHHMQGAEKPQRRQQQPSRAHQTSGVESKQRKPTHHQQQQHQQVRAPAQAAGQRRYGTHRPPQKGQPDTVVRQAAPQPPSSRGGPHQALDVPFSEQVYHDLPSIRDPMTQQETTVQYAKPKKYRNTKPRVHQATPLSCTPMKDIDLSFRSFDLIPPPQSRARRAPPVFDRSFERASLFGRHGLL